MDYNDDFLMKKKKETENLLHFLQQCKYAGSIDTKIDLNIIIKTITNYLVITDELKKEVKKLKEENQNLKNKEK